MKKESVLKFPDLAQWIIDQTKKAGAQECRVSLSKTRFVQIDYRDRKPENIKEATTQQVGLEVILNKRYAAQSTPDMRQSTLSGFIEDVVANAGIMEEDPYRSLPDPELYKGRNTADLQLSDPDYTQLTPEIRHEMVKTAEDACFQGGGDKVISVESGEYDQFHEEYIMSSNGFEDSSKGTVCQIGVVMTAKDEGDRKPAGYCYATSRFRNDLPEMKFVGADAAKRTLDLLGAKKIPTAKIPIVIENRVAERLIGDLAYPLTGASIQQKRSFLADKKGQKVGSNLLTVTDDPMIPRGLGSRYYDSDGFPGKRREIFTEGVLNDFIIDWYYSRKLELAPTGGSTSNIIIQPGKRSLDELLKDLPRCILITGFIGGNCNSTTGDFSVGIFGKLFEKGQPVQSIAEMNIADNHLNFWNKLAEVANDTWVYSSIRTPSLLFNDVVVSGI